jgi:hypothetical protein
MNSVEMNKLNITGCHINEIFLVSDGTSTYSRVDFHIQRLSLSSYFELSTAKPVKFKDLITAKWISFTFGGVSNGTVDKG